MTDFSYQELVQTTAWETTAFGVATLDAAGKGAGQYTSKDVGRAMKASTAQDFVECASGNEIEGFIASIEPFPVNSGFSLGSIQKGQRRRVKAGGAITINTMVVAGTPPATGAVETLANVISGAPTTYKWKFIRNFTNSNPSADAVSGNEILIERI